MALPLCSASSILNPQCEPQNPSLPSLSLQGWTWMAGCLLHCLLGHFDPALNYNTEDRIGVWKMTLPFLPSDLFVRFKWCDMIWYMIHNMIYDTIYRMIWYDIIWYDVYVMIWYMIRYMIWYDIIYSICYDTLWYNILLTASGLTPGGSSTVHIYTQTIHKTRQLTLIVLMWRIGWAHNNARK